MAVKYLAGDRIIGTAAERAALSGSTLTAIPQTSWKELDRVTLGSAGDVLDCNGSGSGFAVKDNLMILIIGYKSGNAQIEDLTFNGDTGANYNQRNSENGGDDAQTGQDSIQFGIDSEDDEFAVITVRNMATQQKMVYGNTSVRGTAGAGYIGNRFECGGSWNNTANAITRVTLTNAPHTGDLDTGSEMVILGCDDDEADSGTNFWQELASPTSTSGTITTTFTAKKYLWCNVRAENSGNIQPELILGGGGSIDTGNNYASRGSINGGTDWTRTSQDSIESEHATASPIYGSCFGVNVANKEKLWIIHWIYENTGAGNAPERIETVGKWTNTSAQANTIGFKQASNGSYTASRFRLWGSD